MTIRDTIDRVYREFHRYTGDGKPNEPTGAALPIGDPQSGVHSPKKADLRAAFANIGDVIDQSAEDAAASAALAAQIVADAGLAEQRFVRVDVVDTEGGDPGDDYEPADEIDGVALVAGMLLLRATPAGDPADGIYIVPASGAAARAELFNTYDSLPGTGIRVMLGAEYANTEWRVNSAQGGTLGVTDILIETQQVELENSFVSSPAVLLDIDTVLNGMRHINVNRFGVDGTGSAGDMAAWQRAIEEGVPLYVGPGDWIVSEGLYHETSGADARGLILAGAGQNVTRFDWRGSSEFMLTMNGYDGITDFAFQRGARLSGFRIQPSPGEAGAAAGGIYARACWDAVIDGVTVQGVTGDGYKLNAGVPPGDPDSSSNFLFHMARAFFCGGYGFDLRSENGVVGVADIAMVGCYGNGNTLDGCRVRGVYIFRMIAGAMTANGAAGVNGGLIIDYNATVDNQSILIDQTEFGNGNHEYDIFLRSSRNTRILMPMFTANAGEAASKGILFGVNGEASTVWNTLVDRPRFRIDASLPYTAFDIKNTVLDLEIVDPYFQIFGASGQTRYSVNAAAKGVRVNQKNLLSRGFKAETVNNFTPDLDHANFHRCTFDAAVTVNNPTTSASLLGGEKFTLTLVNTSGGALTPTFGSGYSTVAPSVGSGKRRIVDFAYEPNSGVWVQVGSWSPDI